ncbi:MAG: MurT ligase domain-containing protein [Pseudonocardia sp.]
MAGGLPPLTWVAAHAGLAAAALSRRLGLGAGSMIGGRVTMRLDATALSNLAAGRRVVLVSGTNGKTTTSHLVAAALGTAGSVAHNDSGSNMADGVIAALARRRDAPFAVLEVDELHLAAVADAVDPAVVVLLNLTRDQLDRTSEVRQTAAAIGDALARLPGAVVIANADDPMTVAAARAARLPVWVRGGASWRADVASCPSCGELLEYDEQGGWSCRCGLRRPEPSWWLCGDVAHTAGRAVPLSLQLPGRINFSNATMALAAVEALGVPGDAAARAFAGLREVAGRYATVQRGSQTLRLLLAKNPAGWVETFPVLTEPRPLVLSVNARAADGRDTSWLWDVPFEQITPRPMVATGERAADLGARLSYADLDHRTTADLASALACLPAGPVDVVANYTAFHQLRRELRP